MTIVFGDIEGSTRRWEADPAGMRVSLARHDELVEAIVSEGGGVVFKHTGDGFGAAFGSASGAVSAAAALAAAFAAEEWPGSRISVRLGLHTGELEPTGEDYFGPTVNRAARVADAANGGQIVLSGSRAGLGDAFVDSYAQGRRSSWDDLDPELLLL